MRVPEVVMWPHSHITAGEDAAWRQRLSEIVRLHALGRDKAPEGLYAGQPFHNRSA